MEDGWGLVQRLIYFPAGFLSLLSASLGISNFAGHILSQPYCLILPAMALACFP